MYYFGRSAALAQRLILQQQVAIAPYWQLVSFASWVLIESSSLGAISWVAPKTSQLGLRLI